MTQPVRSYAFNRCRVDVWHEDFVETVFADGLACPALFAHDDHARQTASECGYATDAAGVRQLHLEHELAHTFVAEALGYPWSLCLRRVAAGLPWTFDVARDVEERLVLQFQHYVNGGRPQRLLRAELGPRLLALAEEFKRIARGGAGA
jgi:hypothetical protein